MDKMKSPENKTEGKISRMAKKLALALGLMVATERGAHAAEATKDAQVPKVGLFADDVKLEEKIKFVSSDDKTTQVASNEEVKHHTDSKDLSDRPTR